MPELQLTKPVRAHGDDISVLELSEPTGKDVRELGLPYSVGADQCVSINTGIVAKYIERLAKVPPSTVDDMSPSDLNTISWVVAGFFLKG